MFEEESPADLEPTIYRIEIIGKEKGDTWDRLILVVNDPATETLYSAWTSRWSEPANRVWLEELPTAYKALRSVTQGNNIVFEDPEPPTTNLWEGLTTPGRFYHHTSVHEMRSEKTPGGHGHQACYSAQGMLVSDGVSAGTADFWHYSSWKPWIGGQSHKQEDVYPYIRACQLDGNPVHPDSVGLPFHLTHALMFKGPKITEYLYCRPPIPNNKPLLEPGQRP